jgi:hypothetical protein
LSARGSGSPGTGTKRGRCRRHRRRRPPSTRPTTPDAPGRRSRRGLSVARTGRWAVTARGRARPRGRRHPGEPGCCAWDRLADPAEPLRNRSAVRDEQRSRLGN